jgi:hypothetical protein
MLRTLKAAIAAGVVSFAAAGSLPAQAQSISFGTQAGVNIGKDIAIGHSDQVSVGVNGGNVEVKGGVADGARVGDSGARIGIGGGLSLPIVPGVPGIKLPSW